MKKYGDEILNLPIPPAQLRFYQEITTKTKDEKQNNTSNLQEIPTTEVSERNISPENTQSLKRKGDNVIESVNNAKRYKDDQHTIRNKDFLNYLYWLATRDKQQNDDKENENIETQKGGIQTSKKEYKNRSEKIITTLPEDTDHFLSRPYFNFIQHDTE